MKKYGESLSGQITVFLNESGLSAEDRIVVAISVLATTLGHIVDTDINIEDTEKLGSVLLEAAAAWAAEYCENWRQQTTKGHHDDTR